MTRQFNQPQPNFTQLTDYSTRFPNINFVKYLQLLATPDLLVAATALFFPDFVLYKDAVILKFRFDQENFEQWYNHFSGNIREIEVMLDTVEVAGHLFPDQFAASGYENIEYFGERLKVSWEAELHRLYPDRQFVIMGEKHDTFDDYVITFWQE